jgi:hypothetical protein
VKTLCILAFCLLATAAQAFPVRILYDNSGSMYPGYRPPGSPDRRTREQLGVRFFHRSPRFVPWLDEFIGRQGGIDAGTIGMWTFTSHGAFTPADIRQVHPVVTLRDFRTETAIANFPARTGSRTYLTETLQEFTRGYTGIVWLITDNIVETTAGEPDAGVQRFFETLAQSNEIRSVHLYKHSFEENGQSAALAVYGILVSAAEIPERTLAEYDGKFRDLFPGREHLKLKNLAIEPVTLRADLQLVLADRDKGLFKEGQSVGLELDGEIRSRLTQHSVTAAHYDLAVDSPFVPETWAQRDLGAKSLAPEVFDSAGDDVHNEIPPNGAKRIRAQLRSNQPVSFTPSGLAEWLRLAWSGATVRYTGAVRMSLTDVRVRLQRQQMAGIFGIDHASSIFSFQDVTSLSGIRPSIVPVTFALRTGSSRTAILLAILAVLGAIAVATAFVLSRKQTFHINIAGTETITALRRLGTHNIAYEGKLLGRLSRGLGSSYGFHPANGNPAFAIVPVSGGDTWDVRFTGGPTRRLSINAQGGRAVQKQPKPGAAASRAGPAPPPPMSRTVPPPGRPPRIGR